MRQSPPPCSCLHVLSASFTHATPTSFLFGAIQGKVEVEGLGDDMASPHPSMRGGASVNRGGFLDGMEDKGCHNVTVRDK